MSNTPNHDTSASQQISLPIDSLIPQILQKLKLGKENLVIVAPPACGKTTRVPPAILKAILNGDLQNMKVLVVEPRRLAAVAAAKHIARCEPWTCGEELGWSVRLDQNFGPHTQLLFITTGMLLNYLVQNPLMEDVATVIFDEFHERSLEMDLALAMLRTLQTELSAPLQIIIMSATLQTEPIESFLEPCQVLHSDSALFPLHIHYSKTNIIPNTRDFAPTVHAAIQRALECSPGDVLVFLPGLYEIQQTRALGQETWGEQFELKILHASLPLHEQNAILNPDTSKRRIIYSTNVAESSVTIPNIRIVVDTGLHKSKVFDPQSGLEHLEAQRISKHSATQRAGRAARNAPGICLRLWTEATQIQLPEQTTPEILRLDLSQALLQTLAWGLAPGETLHWLQEPPPRQWACAVDLLEMLQATQDAKLTKLGLRMAKLPLHPRLARWMLAARELHCADDAALLAVFLSEAPYRKKENATLQSPNVLDNLQAFRAYINTRQGAHLAKLHQELLARLKHNKPHHQSPAPGALGQSLLCAYSDRVAMQRPKPQSSNDPVDPDADKKAIHALMSGNKGVVIREGHSLRKAKFFIALDIDLVSGKERAESNIHKAYPIEQSLLPFQKVVRVRYEADKDRVIACEAMAYDIFTLYEKHLHDSAYDTALDKEIARAAAQNPNAALDWDNAQVNNFRARLRFVDLYEPHLRLPEFSIDDAIKLLPKLCKNKRSFLQIKQTPITPYLQAMLSPQQKQALQKLAPEHYTLPSGRSVAVDYTKSPPIIRAKIQEFFGLHELPRLCNQKAQTILHICAPNGRLEQVTQDLDSFWKNTYPELRKILRARYPKHAWPLPAP